MKMINLLTPRFELITNYPDNNYPVGTIYSALYNFNEDCIAWRLNNPDGSIYNGSDKNYSIVLISFSELKSFPKIFRNLLWFEKRELEELPSYIKLKNEIIEVKHWEKGNFLSGFIPVFKNRDPNLEANWMFWKKHSLPSSKEEHLINKSS